MNFVLIFFGELLGFFKFQSLAVENYIPAKDVLITYFFSDHAWNSTAIESIVVLYYIVVMVQVLFQMHCLSKICLNTLEFNISHACFYWEYQLDC